MTFTGTKTDCLTLATLANKTAGFPLRGHHIGPGPHVPMPDTWDGKGEVPPGWTAYSDQSIEVSADGKAFDIPIDPTLDATSDKLSIAEKTTLTAVLAKGVVEAIAEEEVIPG